MPPTTSPTAGATPPATTSAQALQNLQSFQGQMKAPQDILSGQEQQLGVPQAQQQVSGLRQAITNTTNLLNQVAPSVYGRTGGSLVTTAQAGRQIQNEQAPISQELQKQATDLTNTEGDLNTNMSRAQALAQLQETGQQTQLANLQDVYKALYGQEQDALARQLEQQKLAEQQREFNLTPRSSGGGGITINPSGNQGPQAPPAVMAPKNGQNGQGGYAFQTSGGQPISAAKYAQMTGAPLADILRSMASSGDAGAAQAYNKLQQAQVVVRPDQLNNWAKQNLNAFFWDM